MKSANDELIFGLFRNIVSLLVFCGKKAYNLEYNQRPEKMIRCLPMSLLARI